MCWNIIFNNLVQYEYKYLKTHKCKSLMEILSSAKTVFLNQTAAKQRNAIDASIACKNRSLEFIPSLVFGNASAEERNEENEKTWENNNK